LNKTSSQIRYLKVKKTSSILGWREYITTTIVYQSPQNRGKEIGEEIKITNQPVKELVLPCH
jgi:predicted transcriptional regulator